MIWGATVTFDVLVFAMTEYLRSPGNGNGAAAMSEDPSASYCCPLIITAPTKGVVPAAGAGMSMMNTTLFIRCCIKEGASLDESVVFTTQPICMVSGATRIRFFTSPIQLLPSPCAVTDLKPCSAEELYA